MSKSPSLYYSKENRPSKEFPIKQVSEPQVMWLFSKRSAHHMVQCNGLAIFISYPVWAFLGIPLRAFMYSFIAQLICTHNHSFYSSRCPPDTRKILRTYTFLKILTNIARYLAQTNSTQWMIVVNDHLHVVSLWLVSRDYFDQSEIYLTWHWDGWYYQISAVFTVNKLPKPWPLEYKIQFAIEVNIVASGRILSRLEENYGCKFLEQRMCWKESI